MSPRTRPLRIKLTLWYLLVFLLIQTGLTVTVILLRWDSIETWKRKREAEAARVMVENILVAEPARLSPEVIADLVPSDAGFVGCAVRDGSGIVQASWGVKDDRALPFSLEESFSAGVSRLVFQTLDGMKAARLRPGERSLRLLTLPFRFRDGVYYLQALWPARFTLGPIRKEILINGPVGLIAALVASWLIAGRAVAPIQELSVAAKSLSPTSLGEAIHLRTTDDEVSELHEELNSALRRLHAGYRAQERFISNVSHELKTPIAVLLTESQVVQIGPGSLERFRRYAGRVEGEMQRLARLVESFLTLARSDLAEGPPLLKRVSMNDVLLDSVRRCASLAEKLDVRLVPHLVPPEASEDEPLVAGDPELLRTMIDNVVRNAIAHSPRGSSVEITARREEGELIVSVRDNGPGIPAEYIDRVFDRLVRVPGDSTPLGGKGLGLAITRNIARLHDGEVRVANNETEGCTFSVHLPLAPPETPQGLATETPGCPPSPRRPASTGSVVS